jgi:hypothetical protein
MIEASRRFYFFMGMNGGWPQTTRVSRLICIEGWLAFWTVRIFRAARPSCVSILDSRMDFPYNSIFLSPLEYALCVGASVRAKERNSNTGKERRAFGYFFVSC